MATAIALALGFQNETTLPTGAAVAALVFICIFVAGFAWSWGPAVWVLGAEIQTMETRASGMSSVVFCNYIMSFVIGESLEVIWVGIGLGFWWQEVESGERGAGRRKQRAGWMGTAFAVLGSTTPAQPEVLP